MLEAIVHPAGDPPFSAQVVELRPNSILLRAAEGLAFRSKVLVEVAGARLRGEVVYSNEGQLAVTFPVTPEIFEIIEAVDAALDDAPRIEPSPDIMAAIDDALDMFSSADLPTLANPEALTSTVDLPDAEEELGTPAAESGPPPIRVRDGAIETNGPLEALGICLILQSGRAVTAAVDGWLPATVHLPVPEGPLVLDAKTVVEGWASLTARDAHGLHRAVTALRGTLDTEREPVDPPSDRSALAESAVSPNAPSAPEASAPAASGTTPSARAASESRSPGSATSDIESPEAPESPSAEPEDKAADEAPAHTHSFELAPPAPPPTPTGEATTDLVPEPPITDGYPVLDEDDRTVRFASHEQFVAQYAENLSKQGMVVEMGPVPMATTRAFLLHVPGAGPIEILARAVYSSENNVGFAIERFGSVRPQLEAIAHGAAPEPSASPDQQSPQSDGPAAAHGSAATHGPAATDAPHKVDGYDGPLRPAEGPRPLMQLRARRPDSLFDAGGSYLRTLDFVFGRRLDCVLEIREHPVTVRIWVQAGRVVFATREPEAMDDRLGRRLLAKRSITPRGLQEALDMARTSGQALGSLLIEHGMLRREDLNRVLRAQTVDRVLSPIGFTTGSLRAQPWSAPPVQARWFPVSGNALLAEVIRERLRNISPEELESKLHDELDRTVIVDLAAIEPRYRIREKEHRVFSRAASNPLPLRHLSRFVSAGQIESIRLVILGAALGFVRLGDAEGTGGGSEAIVRTVRPGQSLEQKLAHLESVDHFEALGVEWTAPHHEIIVAYKREVHLINKLPRQSDARGRELTRRLRDRIELAFKKIGNRSQRIAYRNTVIPGEKLRKTGEELLDQAELAVVRERPDEADSYIDMAEELLGPRAVRHVREAVRELRAGF